MRQYFLSLVLILTVTASLTARPATQGEPLVASLLQLIATPERFDGKVVSVIGYLRMEHPEGYLLYLNKEDYDNGIIENALWIDATEQMGKDRDKLALKYVKVVGTFRQGHERRNLDSPGGITAVQSCDLWSDPAHPFEERIKAMHK